MLNDQSGNSFFFSNQFLQSTIEIIVHQQKRGLKSGITGKPERLNWRWN